MLLFTALPISPALAAPPSAPPPKPDYPLLQTDPSSWESGASTDEAAPLAISARPVTALPCQFQKSSAARAYWDLPVRLDLTACRGLQFRFFCDDTSPIAAFNFYLRSGDGWYNAAFQVRDRGWNTVRIDKSDTRIEERPAGWGRIDRIRIAAWRGRKADTTCYLADLGILGPDASILVIRNESAKPDEGPTAIRTSQLVGQHLAGLDAPFSMVSDFDVSDALLKGRKLVVLPHNPETSAPVAAVISRFVGSGGKLLSFYVLPAPLAAAAGIQHGKHVRQTYPGRFAAIRPDPECPIRGFPSSISQLSWNIMQARPVAKSGRVAAWWYDDKGNSTGEAAIVVTDSAVHMTHVLLSDDPAGKQALLLAMAGHFVPDLWRRAADSRLADVDRLLRQAAAQNPAGAAALQPARDLLSRAASLLADSRYHDAIQTADQARQAFLRAWAAAQTPVAGEHRGFWCHNAFGVDSMTWDQAVRTLADNGFTAVFPNMLWAGTAYYPSKVLPVSEHVATKGDQVALCAEACRKYGIECHVWKVCWNTGGRAPQNFAQDMKRDGRTQVSFDNKPQDSWLCPSHPANRELEIKSLLEIVRNYDVAGIHLDYIRYPGQDHCFCPGCRARFEQRVGRPVRNWPADLRSDSSLSEKWSDFRRDQISAVVEALSAQARKLKPSIRISAAVFPNWPADRDGVGQDWQLWCRKGWLDFVCPMDYTPSPVAFENIVRSQRSWAGKTPCYPGIGLSTWRDRDIQTLFSHILATRRLQTGGFMVFDFGRWEALTALPLCGAGITRKESKD